MKIDSHQHFWQYDKEEYSWITDNLSRIRRDFVPSDLLKELESHQIDGSIAVQARQSIEESKWLLDLAAKNDFILGVVGWVDLRSDSLDMQLSELSKNEKFVGVRHVVQDEPNDNFVLEEDFLDGVAQLAKYDLTYDILVFERQLPAAIKMVEKFPEQRFVVDHIAKPRIKEGLISPWKEHIQMMAQFPNVYCKLSGMVTEANWHEWFPNDFTPYLDVVCNAFGTDRLMFGSDWPVCLLAASYSEGIDMIQTYVSKYSEEEQQAIMGQNAKNFYLDRK